MSIADLLLGRRLTSDEARAEQIGASAGIPIFGLDALSSAAYGPEAALTLLIPLGLAGTGYIVPISLTIIVLLSIVYFSASSVKFVGGFRLRKLAERVVENQFGDAKRSKSIGFSHGDFRFVV